MKSRKNVILFLIAIFLCSSCHHNDNKEFANGSKITVEQYDKQTIENLAVLCKVWGFLKYYHPEIAKGKYNWDFELFRIIPSVINCQSQEERNIILHEWINKLGEVKANDKPFITDCVNVKLYPDIDWIEDKLLLGEVSEQLVKIKNAKRSNKNYYVELASFVENPIFKEEDYSQFEYPDAGYRLLALFRYWNMIQYYYPYKYLIEEDWKNILPEFIPQMIDAKNETEYKLSILKLIARINDTHANILDDPAIDIVRGLNIPPVEVSFIENKPIITDYFELIGTKKTRRWNHLRKGYVISKINEEPIDSIIKKRLPYTPASNYPTQLRNIARNLLRTNGTKLFVEYQTRDTVYSDSVVCYHRTIVDNIPSQKDKPLYKKLNLYNIGYLYLGSTEGGKIPDISELDGLIIDLRCYPSKTVKGYWEFNQLYPKQTEFAKFSVGSIQYPGLFTYTRTIKAGKQNPDYFKGKKVILINELTQSHAEFMAMKYKVAPNTIIIGSTTAGADGNVSHINLPGGINTRITGIGVYYPDGEETQRVGIVPDIEEKPTIRGIREKRDEVMERAIKEILKK